MNIRFETNDTKLDTNKGLVFRKVPAAITVEIPKKDFRFEYDDEKTAAADFQRICSLLSTYEKNIDELAAARQKK